MIKAAKLPKALLIAGLFLFQGMTNAEPIPVELRQTDAGWQL